MKVAFFGGYDPAYPRLRVFREGLEARGVGVTDLYASARAAPWTRAATLVGAWIARGAGIDAIVVPAFGHRDVALAALLGRLAGIPVLFDPLVSRWDTQVGDLGRVRAGSLTAARLRWSDRLSMRLADAVVCDTWEHADFFGAAFGVPRRKLSRVPVGADRATFERGARRARREPERGSPGAAAAPLDLVYVGGFLPLHGVPAIVDAAARLEARHGAGFARFTFIGAGMLAHAAARDVASLGLRGVRFLGRLPYEEAIERLADADIALGIFGVTEKAGRVVPHKVFQALALGVPTVTRRSAAIAEFFRDGDHVALVPAGDGAALAAAIESLAADPARRARMGRAGREAALEAGEPSRVGALLLEAVARARDATAPRAAR
ncbi:MAG TPA: glycosyltransferase [Candidatus Eisenbacteria bacterium]|nr:glycosyltransferase [Candidatus Eisenbacteria bacterium]